MSFCQITVNLFDFPARFISCVFCRDIPEQAQLTMIYKINAYISYLSECHTQELII